LSTKTSSRTKQNLVLNYNATLTPPGTTYVMESGYPIKLNQSTNCDRTRTGVANPRWRSQIIKGENASTDFSGTENTGAFVNQKYDIYSKNLPSSQKLSHQWGFTTPLGSDMPSLPSFMSQSKADNIARQKFYKNAVKAQRFLQSGVFIGELKQTLGLIRNPAKSARLLIDVFAKSARRLARPRKGSNNIVTAKQKLLLLKNAIADSWLEFSFGWKPLASDIDAASNLLASLALRANHEFASIEGIGYDFSNSLVSSSLTGLATNRPYAVLQTKQTHTDVLIKYYGRIRLDVPELADGRIMSGLGLTVADIIPTAWELIPWSFFVDYFSNIGDVLEAWSYPTAKLAWASKVVVQNRKGITQWVYHSARTKTLYGSNITSISVNRNAYRTFGIKQVNRTAVVFVRPPELQFELPFSSGKFFNIGALLATSRRGIR
jgi:hypothetical protein